MSWRELKSATTLKTAEEHDLKIVQLKVANTRDEDVGGVPHLEEKWVSIDEMWPNLNYETKK